MIDTFPILEVAGTHQDLGQAIGTRFQKEIQARLQLRQETIPNYSKYLKQCQPYYAAAKKYFPKLVDELEAMASAAHVNFNDLFFHNCREIYDFFLSSKEVDDHCTAVISHHNRGLIIGHNEDWIPEAINDLYILSGVVDGTKIFALANNTLLPGDSVMMNSYGLVQCINELHADNQIGVPKNFIARAVMECQTIREAINIIKNTPHASGFNHVLAQNNEITNVEIAGLQTEIITTKDKNFVHTNHYLSTKLSKMEKYHTHSSEKRYQRAIKILEQDSTPQDTSPQEMFSLLSDTSDGIFSICNSNTIASIVFVPNQRVIWVCRGQPNQGKYLQYKL